MWDFVGMQALSRLCRWVHLYLKSDKLRSGDRTQLDRPLLPSYLPNRRASEQDEPYMSCFLEGFPAMPRAANVVELTLSKT